ncbi:MAG TPA: DUF1501 domain-containing protein [Steroidobacteraceae bacterium]|nr:DUF1501 domain-containing protein [Steroidobacteraceae bacterium]
MLNRRHFLAGAVTAALTTWQRPTFAAAETDSRLVVVILRGALDGLAAVPPVKDPSYASMRGALAFSATAGAQDTALPLDKLFGLNPALSGLHESYRAGELLVVHAVASPYRERSHFDGQNVLENGTLAPNGSADGWLNRALLELPPSPARRELGLALGQNVPLVLRGRAAVASWAPSILPNASQDFLTRLADLYSEDSALSGRLSEAMNVSDMVESDAAGGDAMKPGRGDNLARLKQIVGTAGKLLAADSGPRVAVFDATGWDTHANEGTSQGALAIRLRGLDGALTALKISLGPVWNRTAVLVMTEFGRTVQINGSRGTDHGTATCALLLGGAVKGGRVLADWPGLRTANLYEGRDLKPTTDLRQVVKGVLHEHLGVDPAALARNVFPESQAIAPAEGLIRA